MNNKPSAAKRLFTGLAFAALMIAGGIPLTGKASAAILPDTNYAVPDAAIFMSPSGDDANAGSESAPVKSINAAISKSVDGGIIVLHGGTYRDWYANGTGTSYAFLSKSLTFQAYPHEQPWFDGTDVILSSSWTSDGAGHWYMDWDTPSFCAGGYYTFPYEAQSGSAANPGSNIGPCTHYDMYGDPANPAAGDPQMVFIDDTYMHEVDSLSAATGGNFYYDWAAKRIYISIDPAGKTVELAARPTALAIGTNNVKVLGIGFRRYATNEYSNATSSALYSGGGSTNITVENSAFTEMAGQGLSLSATGGRVSGSVFINNGFNGMGSNGHSHTTGVIDGLVMENNLFRGNNRELFGTGCKASCAAAGVKLAHMNGYTVKNNVFENNLGAAAGFWCDLKCENGVMVKNIARGNGRDGIFYEVSDNGIIASNLVYDNGGYGIRVASANTKVYNNTAVNNKTINLWVYDDSRSPGFGGWTDIGPDTTNVTVANNIFWGAAATTFKASRANTSNTNTGPNTFMAYLDYNSYYRPTASQIVFNWADPTEVYYKSIAALTTAKSVEAHAVDKTDNSNPFTNLAAADFTVRADSADFQSSTDIPSDVAAAIGISSTTGYDRGAIDWPGKAPAPTATPTPTPTPTPDSIAPTVAFSTPANGATVSGGVPVAANAADNMAVTKVEFYLDGNLYSTSTTAPYCMTGGNPCASWDSKTVADGAHSLTSKAYDAAGNAATDTVAITVSNPVPDTTAPTASFASPVNGSTVSGGVPVGVNASDASGVTRIEVLVDNALFTTISPDTYCMAGNPCANWDSKTVANGAHTLAAKAYDAAGNVGLATVNITVNNPVPDTTAPAVTVTPANGSYVTLGNVSVTGKATDNVGVTKTEIWVDGVLKSTAQSGTVTYLWNTKGLKRGTQHSLRARGYDAAGNMGSSTSTVTIR